MYCKRGGGTEEGWPVELAKCVRSRDKDDEYARNKPRLIPHNEVDAKYFSAQTRG